MNTYSVLVDDDNRTSKSKIPHNTAKRLQGRMLMLKLTGPKGRPVLIWGRCIALLQECRPLC